MDRRYYISILLLVSSIVPVEDRTRYLSPSDWQALNEGDIITKKTMDGYDNGDFTLYKRYSGSIDSLFSAITDFDSYPEFMPHVVNTKIIKTDGKDTVLEYQVEFFYGFTKRYKLLMTEREIDGRLYLFWEKIPWDELYAIQTIQDTHGYWELRKLDDGGSLIVYRTYIDPGLIPYGVNYLIDILVEASLPEIILKSIERAEGR